MLLAAVLDGRLHYSHPGVLQGWTEGLKKYMDSLKTKDNINGKAYSSRYIGSLVRRILIEPEVCADLCHDHAAAWQPPCLPACLHQQLYPADGRLMHASLACTS